jgi:hypothetical protein
VNGGMWKYIALCAISLTVGLITGQYNPNRSIVTSDSMDAKLAPLQLALTYQTTRIDNLNDTVNDLEGQLRAQKLIVDGRH